MSGKLRLSNVNTLGERYVSLREDGTPAAVRIYIKDGIILSSQAGGHIVVNSATYAGDNEDVTNFLQSDDPVDTYLRTPENDKCIKMAHEIVPLLGDAFGHMYPRSVQLNMLITDISNNFLTYA